MKKLRLKLGFHRPIFLAFPSFPFPLLCCPAAVQGGTAFDANARQLARVSMLSSCHTSLCHLLSDGPVFAELEIAVTTAPSDRSQSRYGFKS